MKQSNNFTILVLLSQGIGLLITLIGTFFGSFYWLNGSIIFGALISLVSVFSMYFLVGQFCRAKSERPRSGYPKKILLMFGIYGLVSIIVSFMVLHFYNVEFLEKNEIISQGVTKINGLNQIYDDFESKSKNWTEDMNSEIESLVKEIQQGRNVDDNETNLMNPPFNFNKNEILDWKNSTGSSLTKKININKDVYLARVDKIVSSRLGGDTAYFNRNKNIIENWDRISLISTIKDLDNRIKEDYRFLEDNLAIFTQNEVTTLDVEIESLTQHLNISEPKNLAQKHKGISTIMVLIGFQLLILLPFLLTRGRNFG